MFGHQESSDDEESLDDRLARYANLGKAHAARRLDSETRFLPELIKIVDLHGMDWTARPGRAYQYEFYIIKGNPEISLLVEISDVVPAARVYFGKRYYAGTRHFKDHVSDEAFNDEHSDYRKNVVEYLTSQGYEILPYELLAKNYGDKTLCELIIYDPGD